MNDETRWVQRTVLAGSYLAGVHDGPRGCFAACAACGVFTGVMICSGVFAVVGVMILIYLLTFLGIG